MLEMNYLHLNHFFKVATLKSFTKASIELKISQPTLSEQVKTLEKNIGTTLFKRKKGDLQLTEAGKFVFNEASQIFKLGGDLIKCINSGDYVRVKKLKVGVMNSIPKLIVSRFLKFVMDIDSNIEVEFQEHDFSILKALLVEEKLDLLISDDPAIGIEKEKFLNFLIGISPVAIFKSKKSKMKFINLPEEFSGQKFILPIQGSRLRSQLDFWFYSNKISPKVTAEASDTALIKVLGSEGAGLFVSPNFLSKEIEGKFNCKNIFEIKSLHQHFFIICSEFSMGKKEINSLVKLIEEKTVFS